LQIDLSDKSTATYDTSHLERWHFMLEHVNTFPLSDLLVNHGHKYRLSRSWVNRII